MYEQTKNQDKASYQALVGEERRQEEGLELIPSENYVSGAVKEALASSFTNKYSEGYPGKRYYGGQEYTDEIESLAIERAKELFACEYANVQPLSGAPANLAIYAALCDPGDTILGMELSHGGHLTHGHPVTFPAQVFNFVRYGMKDVETGEIDYDELEEVAKEEQPKIILAGFSAYSRSLDYGRIAEIAQEVGAYAVMDAAHIAGLIAGGALENPFAHGFDVITTTTHKTLRGPRGGMILTKDDEEIVKSIDKAVFPGLQGGPHMNVVAAKAVAFGEAQDESFRGYAQQVIKNAQAMERVFKDAGWRIIGGGTDNHLLLIDIYTSTGLTGKEAESLLDKIGITLNKNVIADDSRNPLDPSGIRLGTPAITTRNFDESDCRQVAEWVINMLSSPSDVSLLNAIKSDVRDLALSKPVPDVFI